MMNHKALTLLLLVSFSVLFHINSMNVAKSQYFDEVKVSSTNYIDVINPKIGIAIKYPNDWSVEYFQGNNNSLSTSPLSFQDIVRQHKESLNEDHLPVNNSFVYKKAQETIGQIMIDCYIFPCHHLEDQYLQSYIRDVVYLGGYQSIFDYVPTIIFSPPFDNLTDNFLENVKIASFEIPNYSTLDDFIEYLYPSYTAAYTTLVSNHCQSNLTVYSACELIYTFEIGHQMEKVSYMTLQLFIEENNKIYLISFNALGETFFRYFGIVEEMLKSFKLID